MKYLSRGRNEKSSAGVDDGGRPQYNNRTGTGTEEAAKLQKRYGNTKQRQQQRQRQRQRISRLIVPTEITFYVLNTVARHFKIRNGCLTAKSYGTFYIISSRVNLLHLNFKTVTFSRCYQCYYIAPRMENIANGEWWNALQHLLNWWHRTFLSLYKLVGRSMCTLHGLIKESGCANFKYTNHKQTKHKVESVLFLMLMCLLAYLYPKTSSLVQTWNFTLCLRNLRLCYFYYLNADY